MKKIMVNYGVAIIVYVIFALMICMLCSDFLSPKLPKTGSLTSEIAK